MKQAHLYSSLWLSILVSAAAVAACNKTAAKAPSSAVASADGAAGPKSGDPSLLAYVVKLDPAQNELPTGLGLSADGKTVFTNYSPRGEVFTFPVTGGTPQKFGSIPLPMPAKGGTNGLLLDREGNVYVGVLSLDRSNYIPGIYKIAKEGGTGTLYATAPDMINPNKMVLDDAGNMYITDSTAGGLYKIGPHTATTPEATLATKWSSDPLINGDTAAPCHNKGFPFPFGPAGITRVGSTIYVSNSDKASLVKLDILADGSAGPAVLVAGSDAACYPYGGGDGADADADGNVYVAVNAGRVVRADSSGRVSVVVEGGVLDIPASVVVADIAGQPSLLITNAAIARLRHEDTTPRPGITSYPLPLSAR